MTTLIQAGIEFLNKLRQHNRLLRLSFPNSDGPAAVLLANRLDARESLSRDFRFVVEVLSDDESIALKDVQGKLVTIELVREDGTLRYFNGYVFEFRRESTDGGLVYYSMVLGPWLAYLRLRRDNYLFHHMSLSEQTDDIFADYPVQSAELRISGADPEMTYACQYGESDYNYLHRRWEALGWYYWYEHTATGHKLILCDDSTGAPPIDGARIDIPFQREAGSMEDDALGEWTPVRQLVPASVALASYDFKKPRPAVVDMPSVNEQGDVLRLESYEFVGAYGFKDTDDGEAQGRIRIEEIEASGKYFEGIGNDRTAQAGRRFELTGHFDEASTGDLDFLILDVHHTATNNYQNAHTAASRYANRITCTRSRVTWRPGRGYNSTEPKIFGLQTATVVGPAGEEIYTDEYGRVRVQFHWDRIGQNDDKSSAWIRVATAWAGSNFGMTSIPRIGTEVIVQFLDGNPDRPLITGMVPNADTMPPWPLPASKTQSGILSRSTPGGGYDNANAIRFEDRKGSEQLWLHAEKDQLTEVEHDEDKWVGNDRRKTIDRDETSHIKRNRTETVDNDETITVHHNRSERVDGQETISIGGNRSKSVERNEKDDIARNWSTYVGKSKTETVAMAYMQNVGMGRLENVGLGYSLNVGLTMLTVTGVNRITKVGVDYSISAGSSYTVEAGGSGGSVLRMDGESITLTIGKSTIHMKKSGEIEISGEKLTIAGTDNISLISPNIHNN
ncbi:type VI secretion system tip protein TssI/VgrG [Pseudoduganella sp. SL102]|uniref:type VI secretion system Vgr family protein n=1 Tax=Pseudoduganella sp. SL102 TaxID=2995154 RepID=UPI00248AFDB1|nr:type VI secretion system tip protein TssI/VgrG [Pseudoduganella sp. SL102]WBS02111.1 type VI secretion system tip protein TssI/VgrG [Pseudoduganella sp. SL102]